MLLTFQQMPLSAMFFICSFLLGNLCLNGLLQIGKTKVFLRAGQMAELDARRTEVLSSAAKTIQCRARTRYARKRFIALCEAAISLQSLLRRKFSETKY